MSRPPYHWISVKDRLPKQNREVFVCLKSERGACFDLATYCGMEKGAPWFCPFEGRHYEVREIKVTHWRGLPSLPKDEKRNKNKEFK
jgi:hypothetical protein